MKARLEGATERMDAPDVDPAALEVALDDVARVNRWLGGRRALLRHLPWALPAGGRVLDVGAGSGDLPRAVTGWARRARLPVHVTALDVHAATVMICRERTRDDPAIRCVLGTGLRLPFDGGTFDAALLSMTLHHMEGPDQLTILGELARVARGGRVLVGELHRTRLNYLGARLMASTLWRRHGITRHDGPLSVLRSFTPDELLRLARQAGLRSPTVHRHPFYRLVLRASA